MTKINKKIIAVLGVMFMLIALPVLAQNMPEGKGGSSAPGAAPKIIVPVKTEEPKAPLEETQSDTDSSTTVSKENKSVESSIPLESKVNILMYVIAGGFSFLIIVIIILFSRIRGRSEQK